MHAKWHVMLMFVCDIIANKLSNGHILNLIQICTQSCCLFKYMTKATGKIGDNYISNQLKQENVHDIETTNKKQLFNSLHQIMHQTTDIKLKHIL